MTSKKFEELFAILATEILDGNLASGRLMSPRTLATAVKDRDGQERNLRGWVLCGTGNLQMFEKTRQDTSLGLTVLQPGTELAYLVATVSRGLWQARIVLPLIGAEANDYLTALGRDRELQVALGQGETDQAVVSRVAIDGPAAARLLCQPRVLTIDTRAFLDEYVDLLALLLQPKTLQPIAGMPPVERVCVSHILPTGMSVFDGLELPPWTLGHSTH